MSLPIIRDLRTPLEIAQQESRDRSKRASALLAKVDLELRREVYDVLWSQRRNANPWTPGGEAFVQREPFE